MIKRVVWMGTGFGLGVTSSVWAKRAVRKRVRRYVPEQMRHEVSARVRQMGSEVRSAVSEGRQVMRDYRTDVESEVAAQQRRRSLRAVGD